MIISLNIVMTYPVHWGKYNLFRDFIQNFYDSVGYDNFNQMFQYSYEDERLEMMVNDVNFSYEWLLHIGASTKTAASNDNAGYFGEGFKIASLCGYRDFQWDIMMSSADWMLRVISEKQQIDGNTIDMLAYDVQKVENKNGSRLSLYPISEEDYQIFESAIISFYYPQNPLLGETIWEGKQGAVYTRSYNEYDKNLPCTYDFGRKGAVFCSYQLLGSNPFGLVVCDHHYKKEDRERKSLYSFNVIDVFKNIAYEIDSLGAIRMLEKMRRYWGSVPHKRIDIHSWNPVITSLVKKIAESPEAINIFREKYPDLLYLRRLYSVRDKNKRGQARAWLSQHEKNFLLVQEAFSRLGYRSLEEECEANGGFVNDEEPNKKQTECFEVLEALTGMLYRDFFIFPEEKPDRKIIVNERASYRGMATLYPNKIKIVNNCGISVKNNVGAIYLKEEILKQGMFYNALSTYVHELCHMFGGDSSNNFSLALTYAMEILLTHSYVVNIYKEQWDAVCITD